MQHGVIFRVTILSFCLFLFGCAGQTPTSPAGEEMVKEDVPSSYHSFDFEACNPVGTIDMTKKVDNFMIVFDPSASMTQTYEASNDCMACHDSFKDSEYAEQHAREFGGREFAKQDDKHYTLRCNECHQDMLYSKFKFAKNLTNCLNQVIPELDFKGGLKTFGYPVYSRLNHGPKYYDTNDYARALKEIFDADGASPLAPTLISVGKDLFNLKGKTALIIISDGQDMDQREVVAAEELKARYGEDLCIYTIMIGNDPSGKQVLDKIVQAGQCGLAVNGDTLLASEEMENFVRKVFLTKVIDSDNDGVPDYKDDCPDTKPGLKVDENGCWKLVVLSNVLFDFDKYNLKPEGFNVLDQVVDLLKKYPFLDLHISGHTDNFGSMEYNITLSKRRSSAGLDYLKKKGIASDRLSMSWHSFAIPVATNDNSAGRALNRRLEFQFKKRVE